MEPKVNPKKWSEKLTISREVILGFGLLLAVFILYFKAKPYFNQSQENVIYKDTQNPNMAQQNKNEPSEYKSIISNENNSISNNSNSKSKGSTLNSFKPPSGNEKKPMVLERPLFDGNTVQIEAKLLNSVSSYQTDTKVELEISNIKTVQSSLDLDFTPFIRGHLFGQIRPNLDLKVMEINVNELVSNEGRNYAVNGQAIDPHSGDLGVKANYSSGITSRLGGVVLDRGINALDQIGMSKILEKTNKDDSITGREIQRAIIETNQHASMNISGEATKSLRETKPELVLYHGDTAIIRLKAAQGGVQGTIHGSPIGTELK